MTEYEDRLPANFRAMVSQLMALGKRATTPWLPDSIILVLHQAGTPRDTLPSPPRWPPDWPAPPAADADGEIIMRLSSKNMEALRKLGREMAGSLPVTIGGTLYDMRIWFPIPGEELWMPSPHDCPVCPNSRPF